MEDVIAKMQSLGATILRFDLPEYDKLAGIVATSQFEARTVMESYFARLGPNAPVKNFSQLVAAKKSAVQKTLEAELAIADGMSSQAYKDRTLNREKLRRSWSRARWPSSISTRSSIRCRKSSSRP